MYVQALHTHALCLHGTLYHDLYSWQRTKINLSSLFFVCSTLLSFSDKREKKAIRTEPAPLGGICKRRKVPSTWEPPSTAGRSTVKNRELQRLRGECSSWPAVGRTNRLAQMVLATSLAVSRLKCMSVVLTGR